MKAVKRDQSVSMHDFLEGNARRYEEIKHLADRVKFTSSSYAHANYSVLMDDETRALTDADLLVLCDKGNACFGGAVGTRWNDVVLVKIYTD